MQTSEWGRAEVDDLRLHTPQCVAMQPVAVAFSTDWFKIINRGGYYTYEPHFPQVSVLPVIDESSFVMVRAKRPLLCDSPLELPAGGMEPDESACTAASRELAEETGIEIADKSRFVQQRPFSVVSSRFPNLDYVFEVSLTQKEFDARKKHDNEIMEVCQISFKEALEFVEEGYIYSALPAALVLRRICATTKFEL